MFTRTQYIYYSFILSVFYMLPAWKHVHLVLNVEIFVQIYKVQHSGVEALTKSTQ